MELITPDIGLLFWMTVAFGIVFFVIAKFAFPIINGMLKKREEKINDALELAERTHKEMEQLQADNEALLKQAYEERANIINETKQICNSLIEDAKVKANEEKDRIIESAKASIEHEKMAATTEVKNQIADISLKVAEKILAKSLDSDKEQLDYINRLLEEIEENNN
ncbi:MAG: F0F1 ATP synthase subunit B [Lentimicrobiaceae bacterium]|nr:F0F1 ATP synthase subunit B [Lentimicrobiaceae bacterium]MBQ4547850.1 F0F1 ATP synthase subunit B [Bacteroidales bacterium]MBR2052470.1 F0F1 ATP synthase subunit B [Bacteroidales bacterium]